MAKASDIHDKNEGGTGVTLSNGNVNDGGGGISVDDEYYKYALGPTIAALNHNPGITLNWSPQENSLMQELLVKYASVSNATKYAIVALQLNDKTAVDVSLRINWLKENKKENRKRRKDDDNSSRKNKDKKEKVADPSAKSLSNGPLYAQTVVSVDSDDDISYKAIGAANRQLLEQNARAMDQISANFRAFKIHDNINLFCQARNNIETVLNDLNELEVMNRMPPFPVKLNEDLISNLLPRASLLKK